MEVIRKPKISNLVKFSSKKNQAMIAETVGIKKNIDTVLLAEFFLIKNISIVKAPKETKNIWCPIAIKKVVEKFIDTSAKKMTIKI